jgi:multisubunit Na+/H+ antiporter MnhE subunit
MHIESFDSQTVLLIAAIAVAFLLIRLFLRIFNVGLGLILSIIAIALILQYGFDISPRELWYEVSRLPQYLLRLTKNFG